MKTMALLPIEKREDIGPQDIDMPTCPLCGQSIEEFDEVAVLVAQGTVCLMHENCDEVEDADFTDD